MGLYYLDLFAGVGGFALGARWAGLEFDGHYFSEIDEYAGSVYRKRFPGAVACGDVKKLRGGALPKGEWIVSGGFPCQPHSVAGKRKAFEDERDLWPECARMLRELRPKVALFENVPGLRSSNKGLFFNNVLRDIDKSGYKCFWREISAADVGAPHLRKRIWIIAEPEESGWSLYSSLHDQLNLLYRKHE